MIIEIYTSPHGPDPRLFEGNDFRALKVRARGLHKSSALLRDSIAELGSVDDDAGHVWLQVNGIRKLAGDRADDPEWSKSLEAMIVFARSKNWVEGEAVRAHCEWPDAI